MALEEEFIQDSIGSLQDTPTHLRVHGFYLGRLLEMGNLVQCCQAHDKGRIRLNCNARELAAFLYR